MKKKLLDCDEVEIAVSNFVGFGLVYSNPKIGIGPRQIDEQVNDRLFKKTYSKDYLINVL